MTCDECPCVPTAQCDRRRVTDEDLKGVSEAMFALDYNNVYKYLKIDTKAGENRRYFWMGANIFQGPQDGMGPK